MRRIHLVAEGQTEDAIARDVIVPYLTAKGCWATHSVLPTRRVGSAPAARGGVSGWKAIERYIRGLLTDPNLAMVSTLFDYYGFPTDAPGMTDRPSGDAYSRVEHVERSLTAAVADQRFVAHLVLHETETWVFAAADRLGELRADSGLADALKRAAVQVGGPELVNDGLNSAPSKRLERIYGERYGTRYPKTIDGPAAIKGLGVEQLRAACPHVDSWLKIIEGMTGGGAERFGMASR